MKERFHHLNHAQRCQIDVLKKRGISLSAIARQLNVHRSTISRELKRNKGEQNYHYAQAQEKASFRRSKASSHPYKMTAETIQIVQEKLDNQWRPAQIAKFLKKEKYPNAISTETIYQHIRKRRFKYEIRQSSRSKKPAPLTAQLV